MSVIQGNAIESGLAAYEIPNSLKFNSADSAYLDRTPTSAGSLTTWTYSVWVKRTAIGAGQRLFFAWQGTSGTIQTHVMFQSNDTILFEVYNDPTDYKLITTQVFRDPSSWYHIVAVYDSTNATSGDRMRLYVNGSRITAFGTAAYPSQNYQGLVNSTNVHNIGRRGDTGVEYFNGYMTEINHVDGQALDPTSFGEYNSETGVWQPKEYTGSYGTNGFYLPMTQDQIVEGFNTVLWRGTGAKQKVTGVGFSPDLLIAKTRSISSGTTVIDTVRGATQALGTATTAAESTQSATQGVISFDADGFTLGTDASIGSTNYNGATYVGWCWDAGNSTVSNTDGTITSSVRASQTYGFSVVTYTGNGSAGATFGHGLGTAPSFVIVKERGNANGWLCYHASTGNTGYLELDATLSFQTLSTVWNNTSPTSSLVTLGTVSNVNRSGGTYVAYCFAETGYSKFGSYTGNGSSTGPTVTLGWRPAFVLIKKTSDVDDWAIFDTTRQTTNAVTKFLTANSNGTEQTGTSPYITVSDTGFQITATSNMVNTNGGTYIYAAFKDQREAAFWRDFSGNGNHWQPNNLDFNDSVVDVPTNYGTDTGVGGEVRGNYCTMNGADSTNITLSNGNLTGTQATSWQGNVGTFLMTSGKWYWEVTADDLYNTGLGVIIPNSALHNQMRTANSGWVGGADGGFGIIYNGAGSTAWWYSNYYTSYSISNYLSSGSNGDILQVAFDADSGKIWIGKNNTWGNNGAGVGNPAAGTNPADTLTADELSRGLLPFFSYESGQLTLNAGQRPFAYTAPSGFKALCTQNLPEPTVVDGSTNFTVKLHTGTGAQQSITGIGFAPDLRWAKSRSNAYSHLLHDNVRGETKYLQSNTTNSENTLANMSLDADGFTVHADDLGESVVSWLWKAGGTGVSNTAGTITSTVSANTTAGFSIVTYTGNGTNGATIGHGLGVTPSMIIVKSRGTTDSWGVYHTSIGNTKGLYLETTGAAVTSSAFWNNTSPTSTVFSVSNNSINNASSTNYVAYVFAPVAGYSAFGSYVGNGSADGPYIHLGFSARYLLIKASSIAGEDWTIQDTARDPYNPSTHLLVAQSSAAEGIAGTTNVVDTLSNGFKVRTTSGRANSNGATYIYAAFAENPFKYSLAR